jgi:hypothetical protein
MRAYIQGFVVCSEPVLNDQSARLVEGMMRLDNAVEGRNELNEGARTGLAPGLLANDSHYGYAAGE